MIAATVVDRLPAEGLSIVGGNKGAPASAIAKGDNMNEQALNDFIEKTNEARGLLSLIRAELDDHMGAHPDNVTWGHVGDANYVLESLRDIARFMGHAE